MLNQSEVNKQLWRICDNFRNKTEIKKNYIVYISVLLFIRYYNYNGKIEFDEIYSNRNNFYIGQTIDKKIKHIAEFEDDKDLFSNISFEKIKIYRDIGEENIIAKTIEEIYNLSYEVLDKTVIAKAYDYILEQCVYRNDIIKGVGEFHTPVEITKVMAKLAITKDNVSVYDPVCGSGNFLKSAVQEHAKEIYGRENNLDYYNILKTRLLLDGIDSSKIVYKDRYMENIRPNVILANPPFSIKNWKENALLKNTMVKYSALHSVVGDYIYVLNMFELLDEKGKMAVILPHGVLFRENEKLIRERLIDANCIDAIIGLPENLFNNTRIPVIIMVMSKNREEGNVLFIDASQDYENDKKNNILSKEYQDKIVSTYKEKRDIENYSYLASKEEIINNKFDLTIKKYIQKRKKIEIINKEELAQNVKKLKIEQEQLEENIKDVLEILGYRDIGEIQSKGNDKKNEKENKIKNYAKVNDFLIGKRIKEERHKKGLSQEELAYRLNVTFWYISRIERGTSQITLERLMQICEILDISIEEVLKAEE